MNELLSKFKVIETSVTVIDGKFGPELSYNPEPKIILKLRNLNLEIEVCDDYICNINSDGFTGRTVLPYLKALFEDRSFIKAFEEDIFNKEVNAWKDWFSKNNYYAWSYKDFITPSYYVGPEPIENCEELQNIDSFISTILVEGIIDNIIPIVSFYGYPSYKDLLHRKYSEIIDGF